MRHDFIAYKDRPAQGDYTKLPFPPLYDNYSVYVPKPETKSVPHDSLIHSILEVILAQSPLENAHVKDGKIVVRTARFRGCSAPTSVPTNKDVIDALVKAGYSKP